MTQRNARRTCSPPPVLGVAILAVGVGLMLADFTIEGFGRVMALGGLVMACYQRLEHRLKERTEASNETYRLGYDTGHERGHAEGYALGLTEGHATARPVVVDLAAVRDSRLEATNERAFSRVGDAGDFD